MNIFVLDLDHTQNAQYHVQTHVVKMPTEAAQMLSTVVRANGISEGFNSTHPNHPCTKWAGHSIENWLWLRDYGLALEEEWRYRYGHSWAKNHKSCDVIRSLSVPKLPSRGLTPFALAMDDVFRSPDAVASYRLFYQARKIHLANWGNRGEPLWWKQRSSLLTAQSL